MTNRQLPYRSHVSIIDKTLQGVSRITSIEFLSMDHETNVNTNILLQGRLSTKGRTRRQYRFSPFVDIPRRCRRREIPARNFHRSPCNATICAVAKLRDRSRKLSSSIPAKRYSHSRNAIPGTLRSEETCPSWRYSSGFIQGLFNSI